VSFAQVKVSHMVENQAVYDGSHLPHKVASSGPTVLIPSFLTHCL
jgi:hypothetical protein